jgi:hypothetical protein
LRLSKRDRYLEQQPAIAAIYDFKQKLHQLLAKKHGSTPNVGAL